MNTLGIVTARSGSKGVKDKNIRNLSGKPLMAYTIKTALKCQYIDKVMVSTDSNAYADIAREYGAEVPFLRSGQNSNDVALKEDVLLEVLEEYEKRGVTFENIIVLQPTSPLRTCQNLNEAFQLFYEKSADSVVSVCECEHSPLLSNTLPDNLNMLGFLSRENDRRRQDLEKYYRINGAIYISKVKVLRKIKSFYGKRSYAYIMDRRESVDIDTEADFKYAEFLIERDNEH